MEIMKSRGLNIDPLGIKQYISVNNSDSSIKNYKLWSLHKYFFHAGV